MNFWLPDRFGRKPTIYVSCVILVYAPTSGAQLLLTPFSAIVGAILQTASQNISMLFVGRVIGSIAPGLKARIPGTHWPRAVLRRPFYRKPIFIEVFQFAFAMFTGIIPLQNYQISCTYSSASPTRLHA